MIDITKGILCDACGKKWEKGDAQYSFRLSETGKKIKLCKNCLKELAEGCIDMCQKENIDIKRKAEF